LNDHLDGLTTDAHHAPMRLGWSQRALAAASAVALGLCVTASALSAAHGRPPEAFLPVGISGAVFVLSGYAVARRQPDNRIGYLLMLAGVAPVTYVIVRYLFPALAVTQAIAQGISALALAWVLLSFPSGQLAGRLERYIVIGAVALGAFAVVADLLTYEPLVHDAPCTPCAPNPFRVFDLEAYPVAAVISSAGVAVAGLAVAFAAMRRWWMATGTARRLLAPVLFGGVVVALGYAAGWAVLALGSAPPFTSQLLGILRILVPVGLALTFLRVYATRGAVSGAVVQLGASPSTQALEGALRKALRDPSLVVARWSTAAGAYLDREGQHVVVVGLPRGQAALRLERDGQPLAAVVHDAALEVDPKLVETVADAVRFSVDAADIRDQLHARGGDIEGLPRGDVAFLFGDLEGSTELLAAVGDAYIDVLAELRRIVRECADNHDGRVVDTRADECFLAFADPTAALAAAVEIQRRMSVATWPERAHPRMRMGLHLGTPELTADGYVGMDVHRAARVMAVAHGGQILASAPLAVALGEHRTGSANLVPMGYTSLKGVPEPEFLYRVVEPSPSR
jgi:class 3 adenylate cyclase